MNELKLKLRTTIVPTSLQHASAKEEIERLPDYMEVVTENINGLVMCNVGAAEPGPDFRAYPWLKTANDGNPIGWYVYYSGAWTKVPVGP